MLESEYMRKRVGKQRSICAHFDREIHIRVSKGWDERERSVRERKGLLTTMKPKHFSNFCFANEREK